MRLSKHMSVAEAPLQLFEAHTCISMENSAGWGRGVDHVPTEAKRRKVDAGIKKPLEDLPFTPAFLLPLFICGCHFCCILSVCVHKGCRYHVMEANKVDLPLTQRLGYRVNGPPDKGKTTLRNPLDSTLPFICHCYGFVYLPHWACEEGTNLHLGSVEYVK